MVKRIGRFSLSLQRLRDAWMANLPMSALSEEHRRMLYLADVAQENERTTRGETALDPNTPQNREWWNTAQVSDHEGFFPYSDNLITLMFIVASDFDRSAERDLQVPLPRGIEYHYFYL